MIRITDFMNGQCAHTIVFRYREPNHIRGHIHRILVCINDCLSAMEFRKAIMIHTTSPKNT